jgi:predicted transposase/invertase (TIGR01784 family)
MLYFNQEFPMPPAPVHFDDTDNLVDICRDNVFKAVFTRETPESQGALSKLVSALIGRDLLVVAIKANEPPVDNTRDKQIRFDINCKTQEGELVNVEMFLSPEVFEPVRLEFYAGKLFTGQDIRGDSYKALKAVYQISLLLKRKLFEDEEFFHLFEYYDRERGVSLGGKSRIIILELSKLGGVVGRRVEAMTSKERWAVFFRYMRDKGKREKINEIIREEEGIAMASEVLISISKDEVERARLVSEYKYVADFQSGIVNARDEGRQEGRREGRQEGRREGEQNKASEIARNLKNLGIPADQISESTGLAPDDIAKL